MIKRIDIVGGGNVATHLNKALAASYDVALVNSRTFAGLRKESDLVLIAVKDEAIEAVASRLSDHRGIVAHTSGSVSMKTLEDALDRYSGVGVFYPLQTFSKDVALNYSDIPFFIEATDEKTAAELTAVARAVSPNVVMADSDKRRKLHIASVLSCNFVNHLWALSAEFLDREGLPFELLHPLIMETASKLYRGDPRQMQTGPAARGDLEVIGTHHRILADDKELAAIYRQLSQSIMSRKF